MSSDNAASGSKPAALLPRRLRGLVLEGGGGKGAYQFGCLYALYEAGAEFDAVAGTSVGALNAALWSTDQMEWGREFWNSLSFSKVYPLRRPRRLFAPLSVLYSLLQGIARWLALRPTLEFAVGITVTWYAIMGVLSLILLLLGAFVGIATLGSPLWSLGQFGQALGIGTLAVLPFAFVWFADTMGIYAMDPAPLRTTVTERMHQREFRVPTYATIARLKEIYDPDNLHYVGTGIPPLPELTVAWPKRRYVPEYVRLGEASQQSPQKLDCQGMLSTTEALLASAALPFGIVPGIKGAVDGGVADNMPLYPLVSMKTCDVVLVIRVSDVEKPLTELRRIWKETDRLLRLTRYDRAAAVKANKQSPQFNEAGRVLIEPMREPPHFTEVQFITRPKETNWRAIDFAFGTLNFGRRSAQRRYLLGYRRTKEAIRRGDLDRFLPRNFESGICSR